MLLQENAVVMEEDLDVLCMAAWCGDGKWAEGGVTRMITNMRSFSAVVADQNKQQVHSSMACVCVYSQRCEV
jgi:hypothetical protein